MGTGGKLVEINLLRAFVVSVGGVRVHLAAGSQRVVAFLALRCQPLPRAYLSGALWPETTTQRANGSLRSAIWRIQQMSHGLLQVASGELALAPDCVIDILSVRTNAHRLLDQSRPCDDILTPQVRANLSADLLPGWYDDDWVIVEREQFHQLRLHALEAMCSRLISVGRYGDAVEAGLAAVRAEPLRESAHDALIRAHLAAGNRAEAARQYERCREILLDELGLEPEIRGAFGPRDVRSAVNSSG
jgi:DNA-binding SARP family transcriptional activator